MEHSVARNQYLEEICFEHRNTLMNGVGRYTLNVSDDKVTLTMPIEGLRDGDICSMNRSKFDETLKDALYSFYERHGINIKG